MLAQRLGASDSAFRTHWPPGAARQAGRTTTVVTHLSASAIEGKEKAVEDREAKGNVDMSVRP